MIAVQSKYSLWIFATALCCVLAASLFLFVIWDPLTNSQENIPRLVDNQGEKSRFSPDKPKAPFSSSITQITSSEGGSLRSPFSSASVSFEESDPTESVTQQREMPFLYEIKQEGIAKLSPEQQDSLLRIQEEFVDFYRSNPAAYYNESTWTNEVGNLRERFIKAIGIDAFENLIR